MNNTEQPKEQKTPTYEEVMARIQALPRIDQLRIAVAIMVLEGEIEVYVKGGSVYAIESPNVLRRSVG